MLLVSGDARFADQFERTLYNGFLSGLSLDGRSFFYSNPLQSRVGEQRHHWNPVACCPPNVMRWLASLHHYLATVAADTVGVQLHLFTSSTIRAGVGELGPVELTVRTDYPWSGTVAVTVRSGPESPWTLSLRIPHGLGELRAWTANVPPGSYVELTRAWQAEERVLIELDIDAPRCPIPRIDAVRSTLPPGETGARRLLLRGG